MADFTPTQGRYLAFIQAYINLHGCPPAETDIAHAMCVSPPSVNMMVKTLEKRGLILRQPGKPRSLKLLVPEEEVPPWNKHKPGRNPAPARPAKRSASAVPPVNLYVLDVHIMIGPISEDFPSRRISRMIEIRGDQTLQQLHEVLFQAFDRWDEHLYEFQFGKRPYDPAGPNYGIPVDGVENLAGDSRTTKLDDLGLTSESVFGYWFDFGDDWFHQVQVKRIEKAIPTVSYPRVIKRVGKSPPQYLEK